MKDEGEGYEQIANAVRTIANGDLAINWHLDGVGLQLFVAGAAGSAITTGGVPGNPPTDRHPVVFNRRRATAMAYLSVFHPYREESRVPFVEWIGRSLPGTGLASCIVQLTDRRESWLIRQTPTSPQILSTARHILA